MSHAVSQHDLARPALLRRAVVLGLAVVVMALSARIQVPFWPVPFTLQPLAVLVVGGLLGASLGAAALTLYIVVGCLGLPVFANGAGPAHLLGPTGGYLLAFVPAAALVGALARSREARPSALRALGACAAGMLLIHIGGVSQLAVLTGDLGRAVRVGFVPFVTGDLVKVGLGALALLLAPPRLRALL